MRIYVLGFIMKTTRTKKRKKTELLLTSLYFLDFLRVYLLELLLDMAASIYLFLLEF